MKKISILLLLMLLYSSITFAQANLALNKPVTSSTVANSTYPRQLNDGDNTTAWNSSTNATQWVQVDLMDLFDLTNISISWGAASAGIYSISTSSNAKEWTILNQVTTTGGANTKSINVTRSSVRYLRVNMQIPNTTNGYSINEISVSGTLSSVTAIPSLTILPKNEFVVLGYTNPHVLSINNSLIDRNDQPTIFNPLAISAGKNAVWEKQTRLGMDLRYHYEEGDGLLADGTPTAKYRIRSQAWTHIILQEQSDKPLTNYADFLASVKLWVAYIRANCPNPNARIILDMNWPYTDAVDFEGDMARLWNNYMMAAAETGVSVFPVGKAYDLILNKDGVSKKDSLYTDNRHPSVMASYLSSCTILAGLYEINPEGIAYYPVGMTKAQAQLMQTRAKEVSQLISNTCDINAKIHFSVDLKDQFNRTISSVSQPIWSVSGGGVIDNNGTFTSNGTPGVYTANVSLGDLNTSTTFEVKSLIVNPQITTQAATDITSTSATVSGNITIPGNPASNQYGHCWSTSTGPTISNNKTTNGAVTSQGVFSSTITGLSPNTTYYVRAYVTNAVSTYYGSEVQFTTSNPEQFTTLLAQSTPGIYFWTCPDGVTSVQIECWGGGGAGGGSKNLGLGSSSLNANCGGGGAGGSYVKHTSVPVTPGTIYTYTVGAGGTGVSAANGNAGGNTTFNTTTIVAFGGGGGSVSSIDPATNTVIASTQGGTCQTPTTGTINFTGGNGGNSKNSTGYYSGGGGGGSGGDAGGGAVSVYDGWVCDGGWGVGGGVSAVGASGAPAVPRVTPAGSPTVSWLAAHPRGGPAGDGERDRAMEVG